MKLDLYSKNISFVQRVFFRTYSVFIVISVFQRRGSGLHPRSPVFAEAWGLGERRLLT